MKKKLLVSSSLLLTLALGGCSFLDGFGNGNDPVTYSCQLPTSPLTQNATNPETEYSLADLYNYAVKGTVTVLTYGADYTGISSGSGVIIEENLDEGFVYIITNAHVVADGTTTSGFQTVTVPAEKFEVVYYNNIRVTATLVAKSPSEDIAVLKAQLDPTDTYNVIKVADSSKVVPGDSVMGIGSPQGLTYKNTATYGIVSNTKIAVSADNDGDGTSTDMYLLQIDAALNPGNSGGPLFNMKGELIGINTLKLTKANDGTALESMNFAIPSSFAKLVADNLIEKGTYSRPKLGISNYDIGDLSLKTREQLGVSVATGIYVETVATGGACEGLLNVSDVIIKVNDQCIEDREDFCTEVYKFITGEQVTFTVVDKNGSNQRTVTITLK